MKYLKKISLARMVWIHRAMLWTALLGLFASLYLTITYLTGKPIVCGIVSGCEAVRASEWATTFGIPRPILGLAFYGALIFSLAVRTYAPRHRPEFWKSMTLLATFFGFVESGFLTLVQLYEIQAFCLWCIVSAVAATGLFGLSLFESEERLPDSLVARELKWMFLAFASASVVGAIALGLMLGDRGGGSLPVIGPRTAGLSDIAPADAPSEGPATSTVTVTEFLDIQCPGCRSYYPILKQIREDFRGRIRFVQRLFMLPEMHPNSKGATIAAYCAERQGKFFEYADAALLNQHALARADLKRYAEALRLDVAAFDACLDDPAAADRAVAERKAGEALGIDATPTIFINDEKLSDPPNYELLKRLIEEKLD
jgi:protein-disulfide isomerase/uncharacterized membrane protein